MITKSQYDLFDKAVTQRPIKFSSQFISPYNPVHTSRNHFRSKYYFITLDLSIKNLL